MSVSCYYLYFLFNIVLLVKDPYENGSKYVY